MRAGEEQSKYVESIAISGPSVLTACHKSQTETGSVKANVISWFQYCALQNYLFHSFIHSFIHGYILILSTCSDISIMMGTGDRLLKDSSCLL